VPGLGGDAPDPVVVVVGADEVDLVFGPEVLGDPGQTGLVLFVVPGFADERRPPVEPGDIGQFAALVERVDTAVPRPSTVNAFSLSPSSPNFRPRS